VISKPEFVAFLTSYTYRGWTRFTSMQKTYYTYP
jgi:hypothetical protein